MLHIPLVIILIVFIIILIIKKKSESPLKYIDQWKEKFKVFSYKVVLIFSSIIILLCGGIIDWFLFYKL